MLTTFLNRTELISVTPCNKKLRQKLEDFDKETYQKMQCLSGSLANLDYVICTVTIFNTLIGIVNNMYILDYISRATSEFCNLWPSRSTYLKNNKLEGFRGVTLSQIDDIVTMSRKEMGAAWHKKAQNKIYQPALPGMEETLLHWSELDSCISKPTIFIKPEKCDIYKELVRQYKNDSNWSELI